METAAGLPTDSGERVASLDILRGCALLGMLLVHFHDHSTDPGGIDEAVRLFVWRFVESKSHGTFALLFGAGFAIQLRRAEARGTPIAGLFLRRLGVLALFGFAAHAFFGFNVLLGYAVWGVPLLLIRNWSTRALLIAVALSAASLMLYHRTNTARLTLTAGPDGVTAYYEAQRAVAVAVNDAVNAAEAQDSYLILLGARLNHMAWFYQQPFFIMPGVTLTLFIVGLLLVRHRVFEDTLAHSRLLTGLAACGIVAWFTANWVLDRVGIDYLFWLLRDQWLTFTYVSVALLLLAHKPGLVPPLNVFANAGRMALTNYLVQIAVLDLLFSGYALGVGTIRPLAGPPMALTLFAAEAAFSTVWLKYFRFGPAEWLWRSLTYGQRQPMRRMAARAGSVIAIETIGGGSKVHE